MSLFDNVLIYDVETTIYKHQEKNAETNTYDPRDKNGSSHSLPQQLVMSGFKLRDEIHTLQFDCKSQTQLFFNQATLIVGFNLKFDINWARRIGVDVSKIVVWDCQLAEYILSRQKIKYPSMNMACRKYDIPLKLDVIKNEYWDKGIDTDEIPPEILREYLYGDLKKTEEIFKRQLFQFKGITL